MQKKAFTRLLMMLCLAVATLSSAVAQESVTITNAGSFATVPLSPGAWGTAFADFGSVGVSETQNGVLPLPTMLGGVEVLINGSPVPLNYVGPLQINFVVPYGTPVTTLTAPVTFAVRVSNMVTYEGSINIIEASPDLFQAPAEFAAALNADNSANSAENPAAPGSVVQLFATGHGPLAVVPADGAAPGNANSTTTGTVQVFVQQQEAVVEYSGLQASFAALWQINIRLPANLAVTADGTVAVFVKVNGIGSEPVAIYVQN